MSWLSGLVRPTGQPRFSRRPPRNFSPCDGRARRATGGDSRRGDDERPQERHDPEHRRQPVDGRRVPACEAGQGRALRPVQAQERDDRQGRRPDVQRGRQGGRGQRRQAGHAVPVPRGRRLRVHGHDRLRPAARTRGHRGRRRELSARGADGDDRFQRWRAAVRRPARGGGAERQLDRPGPAGRPLHRRHQARQAGDRGRDRCPAVHLHRREDQGRHPDRYVPRPSLTTTVPARSKARKRALDVLFEAELRGEPVLELLAERSAAKPDDSPPGPEYAAELVRGVEAHRDRIDELLAAYAEGWTLDRMPAVDRNLLRLGVYELLWSDDVPDGVAISEAVQLATDLSTDGSPAFVNGLLAKLLDLKPTLTL